MKTHYSVTTKIGSKRNYLVTFVGYDDLTDLQKSFFIYSEGGNLQKMVFSLEDIFHYTQNENIMEKEIFESTDFLVARIIPLDFQKN
jgi:hypothetical protein